MSGRRNGFFDEIAPRWDSAGGPEAAERIRSWCEATAREFRKRHSPSSTGRATILDIGCGTGISSWALAEGLGPAGNVVALDLSHAMVREGRLRRDHRRVAWVCGGAEALPLARGIADAVLALHVWPHIARKRVALREWRRALKPGGLLWIVHLMSRARVNAIHAGAPDPVRRDRLPPVGELRRLVERAGFRVTRTEDSEERYFLEATAPEA